MNAVIRFLSITTACTALLIPLANAQEVIDIETRRVGSPYRQDLRVLETLGYAHDDAMQMVQVPLKDAPPGTHFSIHYQSEHPFPIEIAHNGSQPEDEVYAILPPSEDGVALLSLMESPRWNFHRKDGVILRAYARESTDPVIIEGGIVTKAGLLERLLAYMRHPFYPEIFTITSTNYLFGYHIANTPLTFILGIFLGLSALFLGIRKRSIRSIVSVVVVVLLLYQVRFLVDSVSAEVSDVHGWKTQRTLNELGDLHAMVERLRAEEDITEVTHCGDLTTPLKYLLYPIPVENAGSNWETASHGVLMPTWDSDDGVIYCGERNRPGEIINMFPDGGGIVRFSDL